jgi:hypothetical protein
MNQLLLIQYNHVLILKTLRTSKPQKKCPQNEESGIIISLVVAVEIN